VLGIRTRIRIRNWIRGSAYFWASLIQIRIH
jgi:hypothetical protein